MCLRSLISSYHFILYSIKVNTLPLDIVFNSDTISRVKNFFMAQQQHQEVTSDWTEQLWLRLKELQAQTTSEVRNQIEEMLLGEVSSKGRGSSIIANVLTCIVGQQSKADN